MKIPATRAIAISCMLLVVALPVVAKVQIQAMVHTVISANAESGSRVSIRWSIANKESGRPFNACSVFVRLIGPGGESTEAFAPCGANSLGHYEALATIPVGGVLAIEVGVAGVSTNPRSGHSERSDWLVPLANDPIQG